MSWIAVGIGLATFCGAAVGGLAYLTKMPGTSHRRQLPELTVAETQTRDRLRAHVEMLAGKIGGRTAANPGSLAVVLEYIEGQLRSFGYAPRRQAYSGAGVMFENLEAVLEGTAEADRIVVVGAHYDTAGGLPGANDNASGVAATLELALAFSKDPQKRTVRWLFFANEELPFFQGHLMGSFAYAKRCRERGEDIQAMISLETIGYYSEEPGSQQYPIGFHPGYPSRGDFLAFVSDVRSTRLLRRVVKSFREGTVLPSEGAAAPVSIPGVGWSDHWAFWRFGYRALMVTDTALYRYPHYHTAQDTPDKLDYGRMARALSGLTTVVRELASR